MKLMILQSLKVKIHKILMHEKIKNKNKSAKGGLRHRQLAGRGPAAERWSAAVELRRRSSEADEMQGPRMRTATATVPPAQKRLPESKISNANFCFRQ